MGSRLNLQTELEELLGSRNVYYQPPTSTQITYDAIVYNKTKPKRNFANDKAYLHRPCYEIIVISRRPDNPVIDKLLALPYCSWDRHYESNNLHHDVLTLYY